MLLKRFEIVSEKPPEETSFKQVRPTVIEIHDKFLFYSEYFIENYQYEDEVTGIPHDFENKTYHQGVFRKEDIYSVRVQYTSEIGQWSIVVFSGNVMPIFTFPGKAQAQELANELMLWLFGEKFPVAFKKV